MDYEKSKQLIKDNETLQPIENIESKLGRAKKEYSYVIFQNLIQVLRGESVEHPTNFSRLLEKAVANALTSRSPMESQFLLKMFMSVVPNRIYEQVDEKVASSNNDINLENFFK